MAGRFYFAPVAPGYDELGRGLARGIAGATDQYSAMKERERRRSMEELAEIATRASLVQQGVREGPRPTQEVSVGPAYDVEAFRASDFAPGPLPGDQGPGTGVSPRFLPADSWMRSRPDMGSDRFAGPATATVPDFDYAALGDNYHMLTPEARARRQAETEAAAAAAENQRLAEVWRRISESGQITPEAVAAFPALSEHFLRQHDLGPPRDPVRGSPEWRDAYEFERDTDYRLRQKYGLVPSGAGGAGITPTALYTQRARFAFNAQMEYRWVDQQQAVGNITAEEAERMRQQIYNRYQLTDQDIREMIVSGELPPPEAVGAIDPRLATPEGFDLEFDDLDLLEGDGVADVAAGEEPEPEPFADLEVTPQFTDSLRSLVRGMPPDVQRRILERAGLSPQEVDRVLRGDSGGGVSGFWSRIFGGGQ